MTPSLAALTELCRQGADDDARQLVIDAFFAAFPHPLNGGDDGYEALLHRCAFTSLVNCTPPALIDAAVMIVPEAMRDEIEITTLYQVARVTINMNHGNDGCPFYGENACNVISLAIVDAALRARAAMETPDAGGTPNDAL